MAEQREVAEQKVFVVGAGFARTGTKTMSESLNDLGLKCYHMKTLRDLQHYPLWARLRRMPPATRLSSNFWDRILTDHGFTACMDFPCSLYWSEIKEHFESKGWKVLVILTERDSAEQWYRSAEKTVFAAHSEGFSLTNWIFQVAPGRSDSVDPIVAEGCFDWRMDDAEFCQQRYIEHNERVKQSVPERDLLVLNVAQHGFSDLVSFLDRHNIAVRNREQFEELDSFRLVNSRSEFMGNPFLKAIALRRRLLIGGLVVSLGGLLAGAVYVFAGASQKDANDQTLN